MEKTDLKQVYKHLYNPSKKDFSFVEVPALHFIMLDGHGDPNTSPAYTEAVGALYALAYTLKFDTKKTLDKDFAVMPLEGLWWAEDMETFSIEAKDAWDWTMMIAQPDWITAAMVEAARETARQKKNPPRLDDIRFETYEEGLSVQILYLGAYADEGPTIAAMHQHAKAQGYALRGKHHEIYLGDPRRTVPEKLKTIIRQPLQKA